MKKTSKSPVRPSFMFGAEFECAIKQEYYHDFCNGLKLLHYDMNIGQDSSLHFREGFRPVEVRTPVLPLVRGIDLFEEVISYFTLLSRAGIFRTNRTCGLHINISEKRLFAQPPVRPLDPVHPTEKGIQFYCNVLSRFDENAVAKRFGRINNKYSHLIGMYGKSPRHIRGLYNGRLFVNKYQAAAFRPIVRRDDYFGSYATNQYRVEFRCLGNRDYHLRHRALKESMDHIQNCIFESYVKCA